MSLGIIVKKKLLFFLINFQNRLIFVLAAPNFNRAGWLLI